MKTISRGIRYALFCAAATVANVTTQRVIFGVTESTLIFAMVAGTVVGLGIKYVLDKKYIFLYKPGSGFDDLLTFVFYGIMSLATTAVFFATELLFNRMFHFSAAKYVGAFTGLFIGYTLKYYLDK